MYFLIGLLISTAPSFAQTCADFWKEDIRPKSSPTRPREKVALVLSRFEEFFQTELSRSEFLSDRAVHTLSLRKGSLTANEVRKITAALVSGSIQSPRPGWVRRFIDKRIHTRAHSRAELAFLRSKGFRQFVEHLVASGFSNPIRTWDRLRWGVSNYRAIIPIVRALATNSILLYLGLPPLDIPNLKISELIPIGARARSQLINAEFKELINTIQNRYHLTRMLELPLRSIQQLYVKSVLLIAVWITTFHFDFIKSTIRISYLTARPDLLRRYEEKTYDPIRVVDEALDNWVRAQESTPSFRARLEKRKEFIEQERAGVFKIYIR